MKKFSIYLAVDQAQALDVLAHSRRLSRGDLIREAVDLYVKREDAKIKRARRRLAATKAAA